MSTILTEPIDVPPKVLKVQQIDGVYIDYLTKTVAVVLGSYEEQDSTTPEKVDSVILELSDLAVGDDLTHYKFVFKSIREATRAEGSLGAGVDSEDDSGAGG